MLLIETLKKYLPLNPDVSCYPKASQNNGMSIHRIHVFKESRFYNCTPDSKRSINKIRLNTCV